MRMPLRSVRWIGGLACTVLLHACALTEASTARVSATIRPSLVNSVQLSDLTVRVTNADVRVLYITSCGGVLLEQDVSGDWQRLTSLEPCYPGAASAYESIGPGRSREFGRTLTPGLAAGRYRLRVNLSAEATVFPETTQLVTEFSVGG